MIHTLASLLAVLMPSAALASPTPPALGPRLTPPTARNAPPAARDVVKLAHAGSWRDAQGRIVIGVRFTMAPKWHVYWSNPGDSGLPPRLQPTLPKGWTSGAVIFPRPDIIAHEGETNFGYDDGAVLLLPITAASDAAAGPASIAVKYLVCKELCLAGDGTVEVMLPAASEIASLPMLPEVIEGRSLPRPLADMGGSASIEAETLTITATKIPAVASPTVRFLPLERPGFTLSDSKFGSGTILPNGVRLAVPIRLDQNDAPGQTLAAAGLVILGEGRMDPCYDFSVEAPGSAGR